MKHNGWDRARKVAADGTGLVGHAGAVLLRKAADQGGLTAGLSAPACYRASWQLPGPDSHRQATASLRTR